MRFIVFGAGAMGGPLGAYLHLSGHEVVMIARGKHLDAIRSSGMTVVDPGGSRAVRVPVSEHPMELSLGAEDIVVLAVKSQDTEEALRDLRDAGASTRHSGIFCLQNGIANERIAARYFDRVYGVMIRSGGVHLEPGVVYNPISGNHGYFDVGRFPRGSDSLVDAFVQAARTAGYVANVHHDVMAAKGWKLLLVLNNAIGAITDGRGDSNPYLGRVREEAVACFKAAGVPFEADETVRARVDAVRGKEVRLAGIEANRGSSWQSLTRGLGTVETDFLNGEVVLLGRLHQIPTPFNTVLQEVANEMARKGHQPGRLSAEELYERATNYAHELVDLPGA